MTQAEREGSAEFDNDEHRNGGDPSGKSIEDLAASGESVEDEEGQQLLDFGGHLNLSVRGKRPTDSQLKFRPISRDIDGQLGDKGDDETYTFVVVGRLHKIEILSKRDESGRVIGKTRRHMLDPVDVQRLPDDLAEDVLTRLEGPLD